MKTTLLLLFTSFFWASCVKHSAEPEQQKDDSTNIANPKAPLATYDTVLYYGSRTYTESITSHQPPYTTTDQVLAVTPDTLMVLLRKHTISFQFGMLYFKYYGSMNIADTFLQVDSNYYRSKLRYAYYKIHDNDSLTAYASFRGPTQGAGEK